MRKLLAIFLAAAVMLGVTGCSRFGTNDNPPMRIPVADDRLA